MRCITGSLCLASSSFTKCFQLTHLNQWFNFVFSSSNPLRPKREELKRDLILSLAHFHVWNVNSVEPLMGLLLPTLKNANESDAYSMEFGSSFFLPPFLFSTPSLLLLICTVHKLIFATRAKRDAFMYNCNCFIVD